MGRIAVGYMDKLFAVALLAAVTGASFSARCAFAQEVKQDEMWLSPVLNPPPVGTFYFVQRKDMPPYPFDPFFGQFSVYEWKPGVYLIDDTDVESVGLSGQKTLTMGNLGGAILMSLSTPAPCDPCPTNSESDGAGYVGFGYSYVPTNLWLEIARVTNNLAFLVIHTPETNGLYDLFSTTNLTANGAGWNRTNWMWWTRTGTGQTNLTLTNLWPSQGWFELGTMQDTDGDGLTDAWERLTGHTDPYNPNDSDGDGIPDGLDPSPGTAASISTLAGRTISKCPVAY